MKYPKLNNLLLALKAFFVKSQKEPIETEPKKEDKKTGTFASGGIVSGSPHPFFGGEIVFASEQIKTKDVCPNCLGAAAAILSEAYEMGLVNRDKVNMKYIFKIAGEMHEHNFYEMAKHLGGIEVLAMMLERYEAEEEYETCTLIRDSIKRYTQEVK